MSKLFIVATPLGNISDISTRAINILSEAEIVLSEDSRVGGKLLALLGISVPVVSYHQHSQPQTYGKILDILKDGKNVALITDAGTPGISDPGNELIAWLLVYFPDLQVVPIPGPSAVTALLSISGFNCSQFLFLGFFPKKKKSKVIEEAKNSTRVVVFFESPHRILKTLKELEKNIGKNRKAVVGRELTKLHETIYRGTISEIIQSMTDFHDTKGEFVVAVSPS